jgi:N2-acetyl-L-2,4-diaminobutanoate deacetylase
MGTELGGGGRVSIAALALARRGVPSVLAHLGVIDRRHLAIGAGGGPMLELKGTAAYVYAPSEGVFEPLHGLGQRVRAGEPAGRIHRVWEPAQLPETVRYGCDGMVFALRQPGRVRPGNCCIAVATEVQ